MLLCAVFILKRNGIDNPDTLSTKLMCTIFLNDESFPSKHVFKQKKEGGKKMNIII